MRLLNKRFVETIRHFNSYVQEQAHEAVVLLRRKWHGETVTGTIESFDSFNLNYQNPANPLDVATLTLWKGKIDFSGRSGRPRISKTQVFVDGNEVPVVHSLDDLLSSDLAYAVYVDFGDHLTPGDKSVYVVFKEQPTGVVTWSTEEVCRCVDADNRLTFRPQLGECPICFGTGFVGGYDVYLSEPVYKGGVLIKPANRILIRVPMTVQRVRVTEYGLQLEEVNVSWTGPEPLLKDWDVIARKVGPNVYDPSIFSDGNWTLYWITEHQVSTIRAGFTDVQSGEPILLSQRFRLMQVQPSHILYSFPLEDV